MIKNKAKIYNKLIRDKIPGIIAQDGAACKLRKLNKKEFTVELKKKLMEEAKEFFDADSRDKQIKELADILEVIITIEKELKIDSHIVDKIRQERRIKRGSFDKRQFLISAQGGSYK